MQYLELTLSSSEHMLLFLEVLTLTINEVRLMLFQSDVLPFLVLTRRGLYIIRKYGSEHSYSTYFENL